MIVGIDLGTTNSLIAYWTADGSRLIPNALGSVLTPSVVGVDEQDRWMVGQVAREYQVTQPDRCVSAIKRHIGSDWKVTLGSHRVDATELSSMILRSLKSDAEAALQQPIDEAVITVPAYFNEPQRQATIQAGQLAGLHVRRILNEPTAAAIAYGIHDAEKECIILVYDLGGGTFDVSIVDRLDGVFEVRASAGEIFLGGEDFTSALTARLIEAQGSIFEHAEAHSPRLISRLRHACESAKRVLSRGESAQVRIPHSDGTIDQSCHSVTVKPEDFAAWTHHILTRTDGPLRQALGDARLTRQQIDDILLVGGATRMPMVRQRIVDLFGKEPRCEINPDEVVALGAAVQAGLIMNDVSLADIVVTDVAPFTLGMEINKTVGHQLRHGYFDPIINRNTTIPISRVKRYSTVEANQTCVNIRLYQGDARRAGDNVFLGDFLLEGVPRGPAGQPIDVRFTYDINGVLEVVATIVATGKMATHVVKRFAAHLSELELANALERMQSLKIHPRDELVNLHLLKWAERAFQEISVYEREEFDELLLGFEGAMEEQNRALTAKYRDQIKQFLETRFGANNGDDDQPW